jgi:hypothetical protein
LAATVLRPHGREGTKDDEVERPLEDFDALGSFTGHLSGVQRVSSGLSITEIIGPTYDQQCGVIVIDSGPGCRFDLGRLGLP